ncbi:MAG: ABC transporter ATP-binding protein [Verrucomicrobiota bacterium]
MKITLEKIEKRFEDVAAVAGVDLEIRSGEFFFLLGPSGCGKTTLLRLLAGFSEPSAGRVLFDGRDVTRVPTQNRNTAMVFQNYALWPHLTVFENVAYGLRARGTAEEELTVRTAEALETVRMSRHLNRKPAQLSGGQQQRVALARALVVEPDVLLFDEPLSNLDAALRQEMREEIDRLHQQKPRTSVYVTHDQEEALALADRIAVMEAGRIRQLGTPDELYDRPDNTFVAGFLGEINLYRDDSPLRGALGAGDRRFFGVRPEQVEVRGEDNDGLPARVLSASFLGRINALRLETEAGPEIKALTHARAGCGDRVKLHIPREALLGFDH